MTKENYVSYLIGTVQGYPTKTKRYLKKMLIERGIAAQDGQLCISTDADIVVDVADKELTDLVTVCIQNSEVAQRMFEKWEFEKDYRYSTLFASKNFSALVEKVDLLDQYDKGTSEENRSTNGFTNPPCLKEGNYIFLKFSLYYSAVEFVTGKESLVKFPIMIVLHCKEQLVEFRFDTLRRLFVPERQEQTFHSDLIDRLYGFCHDFFGEEL